MDTLWRLAWALPLVLTTGVAVMWLLKRFVRPHELQQPRQRMTLCETLTLANETRVHLIEVDRQAYLLVESAVGTVLQPASSRLPQSARTGADAMPVWAQRLLKVAAR